MLQELSTMRSPAERILLVQQSVAKFRRAIRLRPEFDRACYNLGTVYYAHACSLQGEVQNASAQQVCLRPISPCQLTSAASMDGVNGPCIAILVSQVKQVACGASTSHVPIILSSSLCLLCLSCKPDCALVRHQHLHASPMTLVLVSTRPACLICT